MTYDEVIKRVRGIISEALDEAATLIAGFSLENPKVNVAKMCRDAKPNDWVGEWNADALRQRVQRTKAALEASADAGSGSSNRNPMNRGEGAYGRHAKIVAREAPEALIDSLAVKEVGSLQKAIEARVETLPTGDSAFIRAEGFFGSIKSKVKMLFDTFRTGELDSEHKELLLDSARRLRDDLDLLILAAEGESNIDWDAEMGRLIQFPERKVI
jgi:hypothetical protein